MKKIVRRDGIRIEGKNYFSNELVFGHFGEEVDVEIKENILYVKTSDDRLISTFGLNENQKNGGEEADEKDRIEIRSIGNSRIFTEI